MELVRQARQAIAAGQLDRAEWLARQAEQLRVPESAFAPGEDRPGLVLFDLRQLRLRQSSGVVPAGGQAILPMGGVAGPDHGTVRATYDAANDPTRNMMASGQQPVYPTDPRLAGPEYQSAAGPGRLERHVGHGPVRPGRSGAESPRRRAGLRVVPPGRHAHRTNWIPITAQRLQDHLQLLSVPSRTKALPGSMPRRPGQPRRWPTRRPPGSKCSPARSHGELAHKEANARAMRETDPKGSLAMLEEARKKVEAAGLDSPTRDQLLRRVDRAIAETRQFIEQNRPQIELAEKNTPHPAGRRAPAAGEGRGAREAGPEDRRVQPADGRAALRRGAGGGQAGRRAGSQESGGGAGPVAGEVRPPLHERQGHPGRARKTGSSRRWTKWTESAIPFAGDKNPLVFPDAKDWGKLSASRQKFAGRRSKRQRSEREIEIEKKLRTPVSLQFTNAPLSKVMDYLAKLAEVNLHLDPQGLAEEGVTTDTPVTIELRNEIMLKSALNLILEPLHLSYVIKDEVLKITSEQMRDGQVYTVTYNVADLVMPIPNFVPTARWAWPGAYSDAMAQRQLGYGGGSAVRLVDHHAAGRGGQPRRQSGSGAMLNPSVLAQMASRARIRRRRPGRSSSRAGAGPGGLGGGAQADFDSLIDLITSTVKPTTWDDVGGPGSIAPFETNLSLVVSQTQEVHEEIVDLLEQLRRLQDLQVTIEVRFITLNDNFFERIGVNFDFDINRQHRRQRASTSGLAAGRQRRSGNARLATTTGNTDGHATGAADQRRHAARRGIFSSDLDIPFTQNSYALAVPQFGGFDATAGASLGFAILSDIEAYFFINAAQGDTRSNVLQAPKVTLFNGQQAFVSDTSQSPVRDQRDPRGGRLRRRPAAGDRRPLRRHVHDRAGRGLQRPALRPPDGRALLQQDRRREHVPVHRLDDHHDRHHAVGLSTGATDPSKLWNQTGDNTTRHNSGTTVQLPTFSFVTVTTTVSVPDGGTVLLGGIKRLSEGRNEFGVPMLDKIPYINRLFKNVGIGRETQSLMMMVTPRIIIQEEEEEKLGVQPRSLSHRLDGTAASRLTRTKCESPPCAVAGLPPPSWRRPLFSRFGAAVVLPPPCSENRDGSITAIPTSSVLKQLFNSGPPAPGPTACGRRAAAA